MKKSKQFKNFVSDTDMLLHDLEKQITPSKFRQQVEVAFRRIQMLRDGKMCIEKEKN